MGAVAGGWFKAGSSWRCCSSMSATLGLIDVAYIAPQGARSDYFKHWGTDEYDCLSRYDGLEYIRLNELGAWCLGVVKNYEPETVVTKKTWTVLANHDVVSSEQGPDPGDALFLDRVAERTSERVWHLDREKILTSAEAGLEIREITEFLGTHDTEPVPGTVSKFLDDLHDRVGRLLQGVRPHDRMQRRRDRTIARPGLEASSCSAWWPATAASSSASRIKPPCGTGLRKLGYVVPSV